MEEAASKKSSKETTEDQMNDLPDSIHRLLLRRNFCCKLVEAFQEVHQIDGKYYKALILCVEGKINEFFPGTEHYKKVLKMLYKLIKVSFMNFFYNIKR